MMNSLMMKTIGHPRDTPVDRLIADFSKQDEISYLYATHDLQSSFVTYVKEINDDQIVEHEELQYIFVYRDYIEAWRKALKLGDDHNILVVFVWCTNEDPRMAGIFPEYIACDTKFGVTKEQRNLFVVNSIDGHNKVFTVMRCFML